MRHDRVAALLRALHRTILRLYPERFARRFGEEADRCLADQLEDTARDGLRRTLAVGVRVLAQALLSVVPAWRHERSVTGALDHGLRGPRADRTSLLTPVLGLRRALNATLHDLRLTVRRLARAPSFVLLAAASLAVGVGANTTVLTIVDGLLWRRLPVPDAERLVRAAELNEYGLRNTAYGNYQSLVEEARDVFDGVSVQRLDTFAVGDDDELELVFGELVSSDYFETLRLSPALGRVFTRADAEAPTAPVAVVLSHDLWTRSFGADPAVVGRRLRLNEVAVTVAGVAPAGFEGTKFGLGMDLRVPVRPWARAQQWSEGWEDNRAGASWNVVARLRDGVSRSAAQASLEVLAQRLAAEHPRTNASTRFRLFDERVARITPEAEGVLGRIGAVAVAASLLVLLVACANVGGLLLTRAAARSREVGLRVALGAGHARLVGEVLLEGAVLALLGGVAGVAVAFATPRFLLGFLPALPYRFALDLAPSPRVVATALLLAILAVLTGALVPALRASRLDPARALGGRAARRARAPRGLDVVVVTMTAVAFLSLTLAALFFQTLSAVRALDPGFATEQRLVATFDTSLAGDAAPDPLDFVERLLDRVSATPAVESAAVSSRMPLGDSADNTYVFADDRSYRAEEPGEEAWYVAVTPRWLEAAGTTLLAGRGLSAGDSPEAPRVALVNRALAERLWPEGEWIGRLLRFDREAGSRTVEVVGVVEDGRYEQASERRRSALFVPFAQSPRTSAVVLIHADGVPPESLAPTLRAAARAVDPRVPLFAVKTVEAHVVGSLWLFRTAAGLASALGLMALLLATAGVYGVISHRVARRTRELGIRIAVGAGTGRLLALVLRHGLLLCLLGSALGATLALVAGGALGAILVGVDPRDPAIFAAVAVGLAVISLLAALWPATRAARLDPVRSLRVD